MTILFSSGWENSGGSDIYDGGIWTTIMTNSGTPTVSSAQKYQGNYALKSSPRGDAAYQVLGKSISGQTIHFQSTFLVTALPAQDCSVGLLYIRNSDWSKAMLDVDIHRGAYLGWTAGYYSNIQNENFLSSQTPTVIANIWYTVEAAIHVGANGAGWIKTWIVPAGTSINEASPTHTATGISNDTGVIQVVGVGAYTPPYALTVDEYIDDAIAADAFIGSGGPATAVLTVNSMPTGIPFTLM